MEKDFYVYILASKRNGTLYIGVTAYFLARIYQHKSGEIPGFTKKYGVDKLVYYEHHYCPDTAIPREKRLKKWKRQWKINLIEAFNPTWEDLYDKL